MRPNVAFPLISVPPVFTVLVISSMSGLLVVLERLERGIRRGENSGVIVLPVAERRGPARLTVDGATSSVDGKPFTVSLIKKKLAPDRASAVGDDAFATGMRRT